MSDKPEEKGAGMASEAEKELYTRLAELQRRLTEKLEGQGKTLSDINKVLVRIETKCEGCQTTMGDHDRFIHGNGNAGARADLEVIKAEQKRLAEAQKQSQALPIRLIAAITTLVSAISGAIGAAITAITK